MPVATFPAKYIYAACFLLAVHILFPIIVCAQKKPGKLIEMNVDLPDETEETDLLDQKELQVETAVVYSAYKIHPSSVIGQVLLRYGLFKKLELRLLVEDGRSRNQYMTGTVQGTAPLSASIKVPLLKDHTFFPDISLVALVSLPLTAQTKQETGYWSPLLLLAFQHKTGKWKLEYNAGVQQLAFSTNWAITANASLHYKLNRQLELFTEYFAQFQPGEIPQHNAGGGIAFQINNWAEIYCTAASSLGQESHNWFSSAGAAFKLSH